MIKKHGGNVHKYAREKGIEKSEIVDFSANINPLGISKNALDQLKYSFEDILNYPDPEYTELLNSISEFENIEKERIILGNGAIECIFLLGEHLKSKHTLLLAPTFVEYERAFSKYNSKISFYNLKEENKFDLNVESLIKNIEENREIPIDTVVICNPNNPTGRLTPKNELKKLLDYCNENSIKLVMDEAFVDFTEDEELNSMKEYLSYSNLIILKSLTKFFAIPGLRLGYLLTSNKKILEDIKSNRIPWVINCMASSIAINSLKDLEYIKRSKECVIKNRLFLMKELLEIKNIIVLKGEANYLLLKSSINLKEKLSKYNIMIRTCDNYRNMPVGYYRIAVKDEISNNKLIDCLNEIIS